MMSVMLHLTCFRLIMCKRFVTCWAPIFSSQARLNTINAHTCKCGLYQLVCPWCCPSCVWYICTSLTSPVCMCRVQWLFRGERVLFNVGQELAGLPKTPSCLLCWSTKQAGNLPGRSESFFFTWLHILRMQNAIIVPSYHHPQTVWSPTLAPLLCFACSPT